MEVVVSQVIDEANEHQIMEWTEVETSESSYLSTEFDVGHDPLVYECCFEESCICVCENCGVQGCDGDLCNTANTVRKKDSQECSNKTSSSTAYEEMEVLDGGCEQDESDDEYTQRYAVESLMMGDRSVRDDVESRKGTVYVLSNLQENKWSSWWELEACFFDESIFTGAAFGATTVNALL